MTWAKGQSGNPNGRHPGKRGAAAGDLFIFRASKAGSAKIFFLDAMNEERVPMELRLIAAREVAKFQIQADPPLENPVPLVPTKCAADAEFNIEEINRYEAAGRIGHVSAEALRKGQRDWLETHVVAVVQNEAREAIRQFAELRPQLQSLGPTVVGGLPALPLGQDRTGKDWEPIKMPTGPKPWAGDKDHE